MLRLIHCKDQLATLHSLSSYGLPHQNNLTRHLPFPGRRSDQILLVWFLVDISATFSLNRYFSPVVMLFGLVDKNLPPWIKFVSEVVGQMISRPMTFT
ncbi:hypothetical protein AcV5_005249 [Taiwanofungus camphoratus]|nr:hypothetical protein AcV5_005249 [Antrodia cinnamomea]KAI0962519.1 hypothetical protein AcV7_001350 [Antrodia cinnamomea]